MTIYSNPRTSALIENWPHGSQRVTAKFEIERDFKRGERAVRTTTGAPKKLTFAMEMRIVDGDDGRTYIAAKGHYGSVTVWRGDMKFNHEHIPANDARIPELLKLFDGPAYPSGRMPSHHGPVLADQIEDENAA